MRWEAPAEILSVTNGVVQFYSSCFKRSMTFNLHTHELIDSNPYCGDQGKIGIFDMVILSAEEEENAISEFVVPFDRIRVGGWYRLLDVPPEFSGPFQVIQNGPNHFTLHFLALRTTLFFNKASNNLQCREGGEFLLGEDFYAKVFRVHPKEDAYCAFYEQLRHIPCPYANPETEAWIERNDLALREQENFRKIVLLHIPVRDLLPLIAEYAEVSLKPPVIMDPLFLAIKRAT